MPTGRKNPWVVFLAPLVVFMLVGMLEPTPPEPIGPPPPVARDGGGRAAPASSATPWRIEYRHYPIVYALKLLATLAMVAYVWPGYSQAPFRFSSRAIIIGVVGAVVWIALATFQRDVVAGRWGMTLGLGQRSEFNPFERLGATPTAYAFLAIRFLGLALVVPLIEEFFLRGFVMRFPVAQDWWTVPLGASNSTGVAASIIVPVLMHPAEALAAAAWFAMIAWLFLRTRNIWDCIAAHAVTNLLMGVYVVATANWWLM